MCQVYFKIWLLHTSKHVAFLGTLRVVEMSFLCGSLKKWFQLSVLTTSWVREAEGPVSDGLRRELSWKAQGLMVCGENWAGRPRVWGESILPAVSSLCSPPPLWVGRVLLSGWAGYSFPEEPGFSSVVPVFSDRIWSRGSQGYTVIPTLMQHPVLNNEGKSSVIKFTFDMVWKLFPL